MNIKKIPYSELIKEVKKREDIISGPWPKEITVSVSLDLDSSFEILDNFLINCGYNLDEINSEDVMNSICYNFMTISFNKDGTKRIVRFNGQLLEKMESY